MKKFDSNFSQPGMKKIKMLIEKQQSQRIEELLKEERDLPEGYVKVLNTRVEKFIGTLDNAQVEQYHSHIPKLYEIQQPKNKDAQNEDIDMTIEEPQSVIQEADNQMVNKLKSWSHLQKKRKTEAEEANILIDM